MLCADVTDIADGATATIKIVEKDDDGNDDDVTTVSGTVKDGKIECRWKVIYTEDDDDSNSQQEFFFDDVIHLLTPLFDIDHDVLFELSEYEREHEDEEYNFTAKEDYENARHAMYTFGDLLKKIQQ